MTFPPGWDSPEFVRTTHRDFEFLSIVGFVMCAVCESIKHLNPNHGKLIERFVIGSFVVAALLELVAFPYGERNDELARDQAAKQDFAISVLSGKAQDALKDSNSALAQAGIAASKAQLAEDVSGRAIKKSDGAERSASSALTTATTARQEADGFKQDIAAAKRDASDAKTLLAEARQLAADAADRAGKTERKVADRHISPVQLNRIRRSLIKWSLMDIRFRMTMVNGDNETWTYGSELLEAFCGVPGWSLEFGVRKQ
jgi:hypothetical protein